MTLRRRSMLVVPLLALAAAAAVLAGCGGDDSPAEAGARDAGTAATAASAQAAKQPVLEGSFDGEAVEYLDFGDITLEPGNDIAGIWTVANGAVGQPALFDSVPSTSGYSALRREREVRWTGSTTPRVLTSVADVNDARDAGEVTVRETDRVINAPVLDFGQERHPGFAKGETIEYYELGTVKVAPGNEVLPIWTFTNGVPEQRNIADTVPGTTAYPPLWAPVEVTWSASATPRLINSFEDLEAAEASGELTLKEVPDTVVNCPFL